GTPASNDIVSHPKVKKLRGDMIMADIKTDTDRLRDAEKIIREKNRELLDYRKTVQRLTQEQDDAATIRENIYKIAAHDAEPPEWLAREGRAGARGVPATIWSD